MYSELYGNIQNQRIKSLQGNKLVKPHRFGVVARMYTDNTLSFITDGLRNVFYKDDKADKFQKTNSMMFEWEVEKIQPIIIVI